jgi:hypothetical protein
MSSCPMCQNEIANYGVSYFVQADNGLDVSVCRDCYDKTLGR